MSLFLPTYHKKHTTSSAAASPAEMPATTWPEQSPARPAADAPGFWAARVTRIRDLIAVAIEPGICAQLDERSMDRLGDWAGSTQSRTRGESNVVWHAPAGPPAGVSSTTTKPLWHYDPVRFYIHRTR